jgi:hypothetical protein
MKLPRRQFLHLAAARTRDFQARCLPARAPRNPDLIHKSFLYDSQNGRGGGVYLWKNIEAAKRGHDSKWCARMAEVFGGEPKFDYFESPVVIDNAVK